VAMAGMAGVSHLPGGHLQRGKQGRGAVPDVVVGTSLNSAWRHRPDRLGPLQRLDLGLLVPTQHDRVRRGIQIQPDHIVDSRLQLGVGGELEGLGLPGLDVMLGLDPGHRAMADAQLGGQQPRGPVGHAEVLGWRGQRGGQDLGAPIAAYRRGPRPVTAGGG
jgi:hypothetical protein